MPAISNEGGHTSTERSKTDNSSAIGFRLKSASDYVPSFQGNSTDVSATNVPTAQEPRRHYLSHISECLPPIISSSDFVPQALIEHLMRYKKDRAIGVKFVQRSKSSQPDAITNMEGALHTFITPITLSVMHGDYHWGPGHIMRSFKPIGEKQQARTVIISASVQPDFENDHVMLELCSLKREEIRGAVLDDTFRIPIIEEKQNTATRAEYDMSLKRHLLFFLKNDAILPGLDSVASISIGEAVDLLEQHMKDSVSTDFRPIYVCLGKGPVSQNSVISLEMLFNTAFDQFRNEFSALGHVAPQGYVYTFDPAAIFARRLGGNATLLNRVYIAALQRLAENNESIPNMKVFAFNDYIDKRAVGLVEKALSKHPNIRVVAKGALFNDGKSKNLPLGYTPVTGTESALLVLHNNSDAFGQNIETEGAGGSMDGAVGAASSAAACLHRKRGDLLKYLM